jgi:hypothetical protein
MPCSPQNYSEKKTQNEQSQSLSDTDEGSYLKELLGGASHVFATLKRL